MEEATLNLTTVLATEDIVQVLKALVRDLGRSQEHAVFLSDQLKYDSASILFVDADGAAQFSSDYECLFALYLPRCVDTRDYTICPLDYVSLRWLRYDSVDVLASTIWHILWVDE